MAELHQVVNTKASVYALIGGREWQERGQGGQLMLYYYQANPLDLLVRWWKHDHSLAYQLVPGKLKPKGDRAWVLRAYNMGFNPPCEEIIAIRFHSDSAYGQFKEHYQKIAARGGAGAGVSGLAQKGGHGHGHHPVHAQGGPGPSGGGVVRGPPPPPVQAYGGGRPSGMGAGGAHHQGRPPQMGGAGGAGRGYGQRPMGGGGAGGGAGMHQQPSGYGGGGARHSGGHQMHGQHRSGGGYGAGGAGGASGGYGASHASGGRASGGHRQHVASVSGVRKWECTTCGFHNSMTSQACSMCHKPMPVRPKIVTDEPRHEYGWDGRSIAPSVSDVPMSPVKKPLPPPPSGPWACSACTFQNGAQIDKCGVCGALRPGAVSSSPPSTQPVQPQQPPPGPSPDSYDAGEGGGGNKTIQEMMREEAERKEREKREQREQREAEEAARRRDEERRLEDERIREEARQQVREQARREEEAKIRAERLAREQAANQLDSGSSASPPPRGGAGAGGPAGARRRGAPQTWKCPICTLMNSPHNARCDACDTPKSNGGFAMGMIDRGDDDVSTMDHDFSYQQGVGGVPAGRKKRVAGRSGLQKMGSSKSLFEAPEKKQQAQAGADGAKYARTFEMMNQMGGQGTRDGDGKLAPTEQDFERAASDISCYNDSPRGVFSTLRSVAKKLLRDDPRYRTLDTTNPKVEERLIGYEGVLDFLYLLGFESDAMGQRLVCHEQPPADTVRSAIHVLDTYENRMGFRRPGFGKPGGGPAGASIPSGAAAGGGGPAAQPVPDEEDDELRRALAASAQEHAQGGGLGPVDDESGDNMTLQQIVLWCTHEQMRDNETMETLIMCHKDFADSLTFIRELRKRFFVSIPNNIKDDVKAYEEFTTKTMKPIQLNVIKNLRNWMKLFWDEDFEGNEEIQAELETWIKKMSANAKRFTWNGLLANAVRTEWKRYRKYGSGNKIEMVDFSQVKIPKRFQISALSPSELADQITLMDFRIFRRIKPRECLGQAWKKKDNRTRSPNILAMIQQFNNLTTFVQIQILREKSLRDRRKAMKRIIKMGEHFRETRNYNSLCSIFSALNSAPIHRLKLAWEKVPQKQKQQFDQFKVIFSRDFNHRNLRQLFRNAAAPSIPHIGIFLQDLVFIDDGNDSEKNVENLGRKMVNFTKSVRMADRIKNIQMYQQQPYTKPKENLVVQKILMMEFEKLKEINEDTIWDMSTEIKKQDERDKSRYF